MGNGTRDNCFPPPEAPPYHLKYFQHHDLNYLYSNRFQKSTTHTPSVFWVWLYQPVAIASISRTWASQAQLLTGILDPDWCVTGLCSFRKAPRHLCPVRVRTYIPLASVRVIFPVHSKFTLTTSCPHLVWWRHSYRGTAAGDEAPLLPRCTREGGQKSLTIGLVLLTLPGSWNPGQHDRITKNCHCSTVSTQKQMIFACFSIN